MASRQGRHRHPKIYAGYTGDYEKWIKPRLGHREAAHINEIDVQSWVDWMRATPSSTTKKPLSAKSIVDKHAILRQIFDWASARTRALVPHNPVHGGHVAQAAQVQPKGLRLPELRVLLDAGTRSTATPPTWSRSWPQPAGASVKPSP